MANKLNSKIFLYLTEKIYILLFFYQEGFCSMELVIHSFIHSVSHIASIGMCSNNTSTSNNKTASAQCCATNRKVAGSIPDGVTGIFH